jgi:phosphate transport system substrate-binding protein
MFFGPSAGWPVAGEHVMIEKRLALIIVLGLAALGLTKSALGQSTSTSAPATKASLKDRQVDAVGHRVGKELLEALAMEYSHRGNGLAVNFTINDTHSGAAGALLDGKDLLVTLSQVSDKTLGSVATRWNAAKPSSQVLCGRSVAIVVHMRNSLDTLTQEQIKGVFSGRIKDWKTLGGVDKPIRCYGTDLPDFYARMFNDRILPQQNWGLIYKKKDGAAVLEALSTDPAGIAFVNAIDVAGKADSVKIIGIGAADKAVFLNTQTIKDGSYPLADALMLYVSPDADPTAREFGKYILSGECDAVYLRYGYMPSLRSIRADVLATFEKLYGVAIKKAQSTPENEDNLELAKQLLEASRTTTGLDPDLLEMMCKAGIDLCKNAVTGESLAASCAKTMADRFPDRRLEWCQRLIAFRETVYDKTPEQGDKLLNLLINAIELAVWTREHAEAEATCKRALVIAEEIKSDKLDYIKSRLAPILARQEAGREIVDLLDKLKSSPKDSEIRAKLAKLYLVERDNPVEASKYLDSASGQVLRTNVPLAMAKTDSLSKDAMLQMAEWYMTLAEDAGPGGKEMMLRRSNDYYQRFMEMHTAQDGLAARAQLGRKKINAALQQVCPECPVSEMMFEVPADGEWIDLLAKVDMKRDVMSGPWQKSGKKAVSVTGPGCVLALPAVCSGDYELQATVKLLTPASAFGVILPLGTEKGQFMFGMEFGDKKAVSGFFIIGDAAFDAANRDPKTVIKYSPLAANQEHKLLVKVKSKTAGQVDVDVIVDDTPYYRYSGKTLGISIPSWWPMTGTCMPGLAVNANTDVTFTKVLIRGKKLDTSPDTISTNAAKPATAGKK